jgi:hypothetical protein
MLSVFPAWIIAMLAVAIMAKYVEKKEEKTFLGNTRKTSHHLKSVGVNRAISILKKSNLKEYRNQDSMAKRIWDEVLEDLQGAKTHLISDPQRLLAVCEDREIAGLLESRFGWNEPVRLIRIRKGLVLPRRDFFARSIPELIGKCRGFVDERWLGEVATRLNPNCLCFFVDSCTLCDFLFSEAPVSMNVALLVAVSAFHLTMNNRVECDTAVCSRYFSSGNEVKEIGEVLLVELRPLFQCSDEAELRVWKDVVRYSEMLFDCVELEQHLGIVDKVGLWTEWESGEEVEEAVGVEMMKFVFLASMISFLFNAQEVVDQVHAYLNGEEGCSDFLKCVNREYLRSFHIVMRRAFGDGLFSEIR